MNKLLQYKNYFGTVEYSIEDNCLFGKLAFIRDLITYEAATIEELSSAFSSAVDDYLASCMNSGREPNMPCKGSFNVRTGPERHRAAMLALKEGQKLNSFINEAIDEKLERMTVD